MSRGVGGSSWLGLVGDDTGWHQLGVTRGALSSRMAAALKSKLISGGRRWSLVVCVMGWGELVVGCTPFFLGWLDLTIASEIPLYPRRASAAGGK